MARVSSKIVVIDNFDSFVYILVQYLGELGADVSVLRNDTTISEIESHSPDGLLISPGPGTPADAGISMEAIDYYKADIPIFGVCLGHQCIGELFDSKVIRASELMHGKTSEIEHNSTGVFTGLDSPLTATRYHSLVVDSNSLSPQLEVTAKTASGLIMGLTHKEFDIEGVQFHPESVLTEHGHDILKNFLDRAAS